MLLSEPVPDFAFGESPSNRLLKPARMTDSRLAIAQTEQAAGNEHKSDSRKLELN